MCLLVQCHMWPCDILPSIIIIPTPGWPALELTEFIPPQTATSHLWSCILCNILSNYFSGCRVDANMPANVWPISSRARGCRPGRYMDRFTWPEFDTVPDRCVRCLSVHWWDIRRFTGDDIQMPDVGTDFNSMLKWTGCLPPMPQIEIIVTGVSLYEST